MGFLNRIAAEANGADDRDPNHPRWWGDDSAVVTASGLPVGPSAAMRLSTVWAAYRAIVEGVAGLPCITYRRMARGKERAGSMPLYDVLRWFPNRWQTAMEYWEGVIGHAVLRGNHYSLIVPGRRGAVDQLEPLNPDRMGDVQRLRNGSLRYHYWDPEVGERRYTADEIFHVRGLGEGGLQGMSVIAYARENFGLHLARDQYQAKLFGRAPLLAGILEAPTGVTVDEEEEKQMVRSFRTAYSGPSGWHGVALLQGGVTWKATGMKNDELQFIELIDAGVNDIARWFNVPVHLLRAQKDPNHSNIEMFDQEFVMHTLRPWCVRVEHAIQRDLVLDPGTYFAEFLLDALIRANMQARYTAYQSGIQSGWLTRNEAREKENYNPLPGLDEPLQPLNMATTGQVQRAREIAKAAAERVVRKEVEALRKAAPGYAGKPAEWHAWVCQFYARHEKLVSQAMAVSDQAARAYILSHRAAVLSDGLAVLEAFADEGPGELTALALEPADLPEAA